MNSGRGRPADRSRTTTAHQPYPAKNADVSCALSYDGSLPAADQPLWLFVASSTPFADQVAAENYCTHRNQYSPKWNIPKVISEGGHLDAIIMVVNIGNHVSAHPASQPAQSDE